MDILSTCYCQQGKHEVSLLLQQYCYKEVRIIFACIFMGVGEYAGRSGGYMAEQILQWFHRLNFRKLVYAQERYLDWLSKNIQQMILETDRELEGSGIMPQSAKVSISGMICSESRVLMFQRGKGCICFINTAFGHTHIRQLQGGEDEVTIVEQWRMEPNVGVLFCMKSFYDYVPTEMIENVLGIGELETDEQMYRHLREIGWEAERLGGKGIGLILLRTK